MKWCNRPTLGIIIASLNILFCATAITFAIDALVNEIYKIEGKNEQQLKLIGIYKVVLPIVIVVCLVMILISGLLITGIVKKRHKLILPWLILSDIGFLLNCIKVLYFFIANIVESINLSVILINFLLGTLEIVILALIIWTIFKLYKDIRENNLYKPDRIINTSHVNYHKPVIV